MCPSFQATRDEAHSTRGRANALRAAMMGHLGPDGMQSEELFQVLDLCLSCHACKAECPSAVDMAKLKSEFLQHYYEDHRVPIRSRLFAHVSAINQFLQPAASLINPVMNFPGRIFLNAVGVHPEREYPPLAAQTFSQWFHEARKKIVDADLGKQVVFFHDTFTQFNNPQVGHAAVEVLWSLGFDVILLEERKCCGRPAMSKGTLKEVKAVASHNIELLLPYARQGIPILGCEPSCVGMLVDEYPSIVPGEDAQEVARASFMIEDFLFQELEKEHLRFEMPQTNRHILYHGHCQQKAIFGIEAVMYLLNQSNAGGVELIESSCCGLAGSFGYEKEHYDLSIQLAEMNLAPAIRNADTDVIICASGTSCRDQILHTTGKTALHPMEVLASALLQNEDLLS